MKRRTALILTCMLFAGCQAVGRLQEMVSHKPAAPETQLAARETPRSTPANPARGFSMKRVMQFVGFDRSPQEDPTVEPQQANVRLSDVVNAIVAQANQLNANDTPEVTKQKAQSLMDSLSSWDVALVAGKSLGLVNDRTAQVLNGFVMQLKAETQKLVQRGANAETIAAVQHLAGKLKATAGSMTAIFSEGAATYRSLIRPAGSSRQ